MEKYFVINVATLRVSKKSGISTMMLFSIIGPVETVGCTVGTVGLL